MNTTQTAVAAPRRSWLRIVLWIGAGLLLLLVLGIAALVGLGYAGWKAANRAAEPYLATYRQLSDPGQAAALLAGQDLGALAAQLPPDERAQLETVLARLQGKPPGQVKLEDLEGELGLVQALLSMQSASNRGQADPQARRQLEATLAGLVQAMQDPSSGQAEALATLAGQLSASGASQAGAEAAATTHGDAAAEADAAAARARPAP
jgi:hypothetical protein